jgi:hypothetical protein
VTGDGVLDGNEIKYQRQVRISLKKLTLQFALGPRERSNGQDLEINISQCQ